VHGLEGIPYISRGPAECKEERKAQRTTARLSRYNAPGHPHRGRGDPRMDGPATAWLASKARQKARVWRETTSALVPERAMLRNGSPVWRLDALKS
jgi:hypothetical protein